MKGETKMTVKEMFYQKYQNMLKRMNQVSWEDFKMQSKAQNKHMVELMYMSLEITVNDIRSNGGWTGELWQEISEMQKNKLLASNAHRQYSGHVTTYWLTPKGFKFINREHEIC